MGVSETTEKLILRALGEEPGLAFDAVARAAAATIGCPIACVSIVEQERQWFKAHFGLACHQTPIEQSFCRHAVASDSMLVVPDAEQDPRFVANPLVTGAEHVRFYAGEPLRVVLDPAGLPQPVGALCVIGTEPRLLPAAGREALAALAAVASDLIQARLDACRATDLAAALTSSLAVRGRLDRQLRDAERLAGVGSWRLTLADNRLEWSEQARRIHEVPFDDPEDLRQVLRFYPPHDRHRLEAAIDEALASGRPYDLEADLVTTSGRMRRVRAIGEVERQGDRPVALIGVVQDITERWEHELELKSRAETDELTQLATRRYFNEFCDHLLGPNGPPDLPVALALIDLDHFKEVNDQFGHAAGDGVLQRVAGALRERWLVECFAARLGGDEFVLVICEPALLGDLPDTIQRLLQALILPVPEAEPLRVSGTIGVCRSVTGSIERTQLLARADGALYAAKSRGRGTAVLDAGGALEPVDPIKPDAASAASAVRAA